MSIHIRQCTPADAQALSEIGKSTFYETWRPTSTEENIRFYISQTYDELLIKRYLNNGNNNYYVAEEDGKMIGYARLRVSNENPGQLENYKCIELAHLYVRKKYISKKVGAALLLQALKYSADNNFDVIWLSSWEENLRAMTFYKKFGFEVFGKHKFIYGNKIDEDLLMMKKLK